MKTTLSAQQTSHFTKTGSIEFELPYTLPQKSTQRDLWRTNEALRQWILRKLGPIALTLTGKKQLRLGMDQWITEENRPKIPATLQQMFCFQGFALGALFAQNPKPLKSRSRLGLLPLPSASENTLFFKPELILDWPNVASDVFLVLFTLPNAVYVHNPKDCAPNYLKSLGYSFGDPLKTETHPLIIQG